MKRLLASSEYTFDASERLITFTSLTPVINRIYLITNVDADFNEIIYNFAGFGKGGDIQNTNELLLVYDTTAMADTDALIIIYDDPNWDGIGAKTDTSATTDTGTFSLISLIKRTLGTYLSAFLTNWNELIGTTKRTDNESWTSGDRAIVIGAFRNDNASATYASVDGMSSPIAVDSNGKVFVNVPSLPLPTNAATSAHQVTNHDRLGALTETAPTNDTNSSGLNGRLQRIAQRITSLIALLPASLGQKTKANSLAVTIASDQEAMPAKLEAQTTGGLTTYHLVSAASTNATNIKASAGQVFGWYIYNNNAAARKVAFHNSASAPSAGSSIFFSLVIPPNSGANVYNVNGIAFSAGIGITTVTEIADNGTTAVGANDLNINLFYK